MAASKVTAVSVGGGNKGQIMVPASCCELVDWSAHDDDDDNEGGEDRLWTIKDVAGITQAKTVKNTVFMISVIAIVIIVVLVGALSNMKQIKNRVNEEQTLRYRYCSLGNDSLSRPFFVVVEMSVATIPRVSKLLTMRTWARNWPRMLTPQEDRTRMKTASRFRWLITHCHPPTRTDDWACDVVSF
jgi:hypothetical protein